MEYQFINDVGKQWIRKYGLALSKELLGMIRSKYGSIPVPNAETTLDGDTLRSEAQTEKEFLITQLRENLEASSRKMMIEADSEEATTITRKITKSSITNLYRITLCQEDFYLKETLMFSHG